MALVTKRCPLVDELSVEVRQIIFRYAVVEDAPIIIRRATTKAGDPYPRFSCGSAFSSLSLTCRKIYDEVAATHLFYNENTFHFHSAVPLIEYLTGITPARRNQIKTIYFQWDPHGSTANQAFTLLSLCKGLQSLTVHMGDMAGQWKRGTRTNFWIAVPGKDIWGRSLAHFDPFNVTMAPRGGAKLVALRLKHFELTYAKDIDWTQIRLDNRSNIVRGKETGPLGSMVAYQLRRQNVVTQDTVNRIIQHMDAEIDRVRELITGPLDEMAVVYQDEIDNALDWSAHRILGSDRMTGEMRPSAATRTRSKKPLLEPMIEF